MALINVNTKFEKVPWNKYAILHYALLIFIILIYSVLFEIPRIQLVTSESSKIILYVLMSAGISSIFFFFLYLSKWINLIILPLIFYYGALSKIYADNFLLDTTTYTAPMFFNTSAAFSLINENSSYAVYLILIFIFGLILALIRFFFAIDNSVTRRGQAFAIAVLISLATFSITGKKEEFKSNPLIFFSSVSNFLTDYITSSIQSKNRIESITGNKTDDNITGIVVFVDKLSDAFLKNNSKNILNKYESSNYNIIHSIKRQYKNIENNRAAIYTAANLENINRYITNKSFQSVIKNSGYNVLQLNLLSNLSTIDFYSNSIIKFDIKNIINYQETISPNIFKSIEKIKEFKNSNNGGLLIVNLENSSPIIPYRYNMHYENRNKYNEIQEKDYISYLEYIHSYLETLKNIYIEKEAFIFLVGINGEKESDTTAMITWSSDLMNKKYNTSENIKSNSNDFIEIDTVLHSLIGCFQMESKYIENNKNLCRKN